MATNYSAEQMKSSDNYRRHQQRLVCLESITMLLKDVHSLKMATLLEITEKSSGTQEWMHSLVKTLQLTNTDHTVDVQENLLKWNTRNVTQHKEESERLRGLCCCQLLLSTDFLGHSFCVFQLRFCQIKQGRVNK